MKPYSCPVCKAESCGNDYHTKTPYKGPEVALGDRMKGVMLQVFDMVEFDNLQSYEIKALLSALIDEHIQEEEADE